MKGSLRVSIDALRLGAELQITAALRRAREGGDGVRGAGAVGEEVQAGAALPGVAGQDLGRLEGQPIRAVGAGGGEDLLEDPAHGEDRRTRVQPRRARRGPPASCRRGSAARSQSVTASPRAASSMAVDQAADTGTDDDRPLS